MQSEEERIRYDRQVRLWGSGVQQRLHSTVLVVDGATPDETLKNLVLAGIGRVRIVAAPPSRTESDASFIARSVVALANAELPPSITKEDALVGGLRQLNNLVDARVFDSSETFENASCVMLLRDPDGCRRALPALPSNVHFDIVASLRVFSESHAFCVFSTTAAAAQAASSNSHSSAWTVDSPLPPLVALLSCSTQAAHRNPAVSFAECVDLLSREEPGALGAMTEQQVEAVLAEALPACGGGRAPTVVVNSVLGGVLSQQIVAHACEARGSVVQASGGGQPKPVGWLFVKTAPHIECIVG